MEKLINMVNQAHKAQFSRNWNNGLKASTFNLNLNNAASNYNQNISTQIMYLSLCLFDHAPWQNIKRKNRFFGDYILLRKSILKRMKQKLIPLAKFCEVTKHDLNVVASYNGWLMWCNGYRLMNKYLSPLKEKDVVL